MYAADNMNKIFININDARLVALKLRFKSCHKIKCIFIDSQFKCIYKILICVQN